jgi:hypothetical protein
MSSDVSDRGAELPPGYWPAAAIVKMYSPGRHRWRSDVDTDLQ